MPIIDEVKLEVVPTDGKVLRATIKVKVSMSKLEACLSKQCLDGLNEEWRIGANLRAVDFDVTSFEPSIYFGTKDLEWSAGSSSTELTFVRHFPRGADLNEDWLPGDPDEFYPRAEIRTREAGVFVAAKRGDVVTGFF